MVDVCVLARAHMHAQEGGALLLVQNQFGVSGAGRGQPTGVGNITVFRSARAPFPVKYIIEGTRLFVRANSELARTNSRVSVTHVSVKVG